jgi:membrane protein implicated in regulation of membrane protease activity
VTYAIEWAAATVPLGGLFIIVIGPIAMIALTLAALAALVAVVALAAATVAVPFLLVRSLVRRRAERHRSRERTSPIGSAVAFGLAGVAAE